MIFDNPSTSSDDEGFRSDRRAIEGTVLESKLLPRISFRTMFVLTLVASLIAAVAKAAGEGSAVAYGVISAILFLLLVAGVLVVVFLFSWAVALIWYTGGTEDPTSPFAEDQLPPQILPPSDPVI